MVMSGIGNPKAFSEDLLRIGVGIVGERAFRDHHEYTQQDFDEVVQEASTHGADMIVTTEKDAVRLEGLIRGEVEMHGACVWRADGRYRDAPFGAPGPLDLMPPTAEPARPSGLTASIAEALAADSRPFCCD